MLRPVDLSGLTARSLLPFEPLFFEQGLTLISQVDEGITVSGDEEALRRVLEILLDNAQKYSSPGGETQPGGTDPARGPPPDLPALLPR